MPSNIPSVLLDTNVVLDLLQNREPYVIEALQIFALSESGKIRTLLSTDAISTIFYVVSKNANVSAGREAISKLMDFVELIALDEASVLRGLSLDFADIEDALVAAIAEKADVDAIITRNTKDFAKSPITAITPKEFLAAMETKDLFSA